MADTETLKPEKRFYVYAIIIGAHVAYIGKGQGRRAWSHLGANGHNEKLTLKITEARKLGIEPRVRLLKQGMTEQEAYALERRWIVRFHDRLTNHSIGHRTWTERFVDILKRDLSTLKANEAGLTEQQITHLRVIRARLKRLLCAAETGVFA